MTGDSRNRADPDRDGLAHRRRGPLAKLGLFLLNLKNRIAPWHRWPTFTVVPVVYLLIRRSFFRRYNLIPVPPPEGTPIAGRVAAQPTIPKDERPLYRTADGYGNDGENPGAGAQYHPLARNMPVVPPEARDAKGDPSPQYVAQKLLARRDGKFIPAGMQLNVLAAAWIQTMIHDWLDHLLDTSKTETFDKGAACGCPLRSFKLHPTKNAAASPANGGAGPSTAFLNARTGWWDASFLYGQNEAAVSRARTGSGGKIFVAAEGSGAIPRDKDGKPLTGDQTNSWVGVSLLQDIFAREHNVVAEEIAAAEPRLSDEDIFNKARLVVSAVVAKVHTIDWTVELLKTSTLNVVMNTNWGGLLGLGPRFLGLVGANKATNQGVPHNLTEEFTSVYRMHMMLPDTLPVSAGSVPLSELLGDSGLRYLAGERNRVRDVWASLVKYPCGALSLFNYPRTLRNITPQVADAEGRTQDLSPIDLAAVDIYRDRERGVPRYNEFRRWLDLPPKMSWKQLTGNDREAMAVLQEVYGDDIEACDLLVGTLAEKNIKGFAIAETAFMIFVVMASRRLHTDRFLTEHFTEEVYSKVGLKWVKETKGMRDVLRRHFPTIEKELPPKASAFTPFEPMPAA